VERLRNRQVKNFLTLTHDMIVAGTNLFVFLFGMTAVVFETQHRHNPAIRNYLDALYFTVATLTTTGFGDITLTGTAGRLLAIVMMIVGVSLFVRMVQVLFRSRRVHSRCSSWGLSEHESDAVHCKRCGTLLTFEPKPSPADPTCVSGSG
jgi:voltage-gated potassium channel